MTRVAIADDSVLFREGVARILGESGFEVVGLAGDVDSLVDLVAQSRPDVAVIDLRMPPNFSAEGLEAATLIRQIAPEVGLLLLSQYVEAHHALRLMNDFERGVGYLLKDRVSDLAGFRNDVKRVAAGDIIIDPELVRRLVARQRQHDPIDTLTPRERSVLALMAQGLSNSALSETLHLSVKTIEAHVRSIFLKLGLELDEREHRRVLAVLAFLRS
ncbi:MAG: response regulator transcription factor [Ilumatobacteraceae bacterium]|nr:MAG: response regulator transcription factor [Actinomycetota bacterium]